MRRRTTNYYDGSTLLLIKTLCENLKLVTCNYSILFLDLQFDFPEKRSNDTFLFCSRSFCPLLYCGYGAFSLIYETVIRPGYLITHIEFVFSTLCQLSIESFLMISHTISSVHCADK